MKKIIIPISALLMVVSCMNEKETTPVMTGETISYFTAGFEGQEPGEDMSDDTKTVLNTKDWSVSWVTEDPVTISDGSQSYPFKAVSEGLTTTLSPVEASLELPAGKTYYAHYPSDANSVWNGSKVTFTTPAEVTPDYGTFPYNASVAATNSSDFTFKNIGALIRFRVNRSNVTKVVFEAAGGEYLAGEVTVDCANPSDITVTPGKGSKSVTVNGTLTSGQDYFIPVLPVTFSKGLTVTIYLATGVYYTRTTQPFTLARSSRVEMGYITRYPDQITLIPDSEYKPLPPRGSVMDATAPGGYYFPLICGIDVAGEEIFVDIEKTWNDYCDPNGAMTAKPSANETAPINPCPDGWALLTEAQMRLIADYTTDDGLKNYTIDSSASKNPGDDYFYWNLRGDERSNGDIFGATYSAVEIRVLSCESRLNADSQVWRLQVNRSSSPSVKVSSQARSTKFNTGNYRSSLRCVRQAAN